MRISFKIFWYCILGILLFSNTGCYQLRKKFVKERKDHELPPLYLELRDYPDIPSKDMYHEYYLFVRGWLDELTMAIEDGISSKRMKKSIDEAVMNIKQIIYFYNQAGKDKIDSLYKRMLILRKKVYDPYFIRAKDKTEILKEISRIKREFEKNFNYEGALPWMQKK